MITSFFSPKSKPSGTKRPLHKDDKDGKDGRDDKAVKIGTKKRVVSPDAVSDADTPRTSRTSLTSLTSSSSNISNVSIHSQAEKTLTEETRELLSFLDGPETENGTVTTVPTWHNALQKQFSTAKFASLAKFVVKERESKTVYPPPQLTFSALNLTPLHKVKVVIVGQDPYHQPSQSHGLSFSVPPSIAIPPSLRNIYKELLQDPNVTEFASLPNHGNLERWAKQGVLLLNNVLTVRRGEPASHKKRGWEEFTDGVIGAVVERELGGLGGSGMLDGDSEVSGDGESDSSGDCGNTIGNGESEKGSGVVFLLWGKPASVKAQTVLAKFSNKKRGKHAVICCSHPSPLGATKTSSPFMGSRCFSRANEELVKRGWKPIDWRVDGKLE